MATKKATKKKAAKNKGGRPTKYKPEYAKQAAKLCKLGAIDLELADFFGVAECTIHKWKKDYPEFAEAVAEAKKEADARVVRSLFERATGYSHPEEKIFCSEGRVVRAKTKKQYPPDTTAGIFWLKNRQKEQWRDRHDIDLGGDITINVTKEDTKLL